MTVLCMTGWQQPADALAEIAPGATHFDYSIYNDVKAMFAALPTAPQLAIGWSLGGQLLVRAIAGGYIQPHVLVLLGAPFQWMTGAKFKEGVPTEAAIEVKRNYVANPEGMLKHLNALIAFGDTHEKSIIRTLNATTRVWKNGAFWLDELTTTSCISLDYSAFPSTVIIHGEKDKVIYPINAQAFEKFIPGSELQLWPDCAHAPHLHDTDKLRQLMSEYV